MKNLKTIVFLILLSFLILFCCTKSSAINTTTVQFGEKGQTCTIHDNCTIYNRYKIDSPSTVSRTSTYQKRN